MISALPEMYAYTCKPAVQGNKTKRIGTHNEVLPFPEQRQASGFGGSIGDSLQFRLRAPWEDVAHQVAVGKLLPIPHRLAQLCKRNSGSEENCTVNYKQK